MSADRHEPQRADARRNREHILAAADQAFRESPDASLNSIAKRAGIGAGTLYRHFPTREALILAVYEHDLQRLVGSVPGVLADHPPVDALRVWFDLLAGYVRLKRGLGAALHAAAAQKVVSDAFGPLTAAVAELLAAGVAADVIRPGLDPADVLLVMGFLWRVRDDEGGRAQATRAFELVLDGLGPG